MGVNESRGELGCANDTSSAGGISRRDFLNRAAVAGGALGIAAGIVPSALAKPSAPRMRRIPDHAAGRKVTLKFSMSGLADSGEGVAAVWVAKRISQLTKGQVGMLVYPNYTIAPSDTVELQQLVLGALDIAAVSSWTNAITPGLPFDLPYAFPTLGGLRKAFAGPPGNSVKAAADPLGYKLLDWWALTWRNVYGDRQVWTPADLKGVKIRTQGTKPLNAFFQAAGAFPQSIDSKEVYLALQTKQVNLVETSFQFCYQQKHYEVAKYGTAIHHAVSTWALLISNKTWEGLTPAYQKAVQQAFKESVAVHDKASVAYINALPKKLKSLGMAINSPQNLKPFAQIAAGIYDNVVTTDAQKQVLSQIQAMGFAKGG